VGIEKREEGQGDAHHPLKLLLNGPEPGSSLVPHLVKHLVLPEGEDGHEVSAKNRKMAVRHLVLNAATLRDSGTLCPDYMRYATATLDMQLVWGGWGCSLTWPS